MYVARMLASVKFIRGSIVKRRMLMVRKRSRRNAYVKYKSGNHSVACAKKMKLTVNYAW